MNPIDRLTEIFSHFPGIGPRQARRFVYYLLSRDQATLETLTKNISELRRETAQCSECRRFYAITNSQTHRTLCNICSDNSRDHTLLMIVPRDADLEQIEKSGSFRGYYFVLGGSVPILEKEPERRIRLHDLHNLLKRRSEVREVILAMNANAEGENTEDFLKQDLAPLYPALTFSTLGRGLSTGSELEYADPETLKNALLHRTK